MPTYTIAGKKVTSPEPLTPEELDALYDQIAGEAPKVEPLPRGPTTRGGKRTPGVPLNQPSDTRFPTLPRDIRTPQDVDVRRGASGLLGIPGGFLDIATGLTGILGAIS